MPLPNIINDKPTCPYCEATLDKQYVYGLTGCLNMFKQIMTWNVTCENCKKNFKLQEKTITKTVFESEATNG